MYFVPVLNLIYIKYENALVGRASERAYACTYACIPYRRIKYNQTRQTRVMNQIISDRGAVEGGIIYPREKDKGRQKKRNELQIR